MTTSLTDLQTALVGTWVSLSIELRPQPAPPGSPGGVAPQFLTREFRYGTDGTFFGSIEMYADPDQTLHLTSLEFGGHLVWHGAHPVAAGAYSVDYVCDTTFSITPRTEGSAGMFNGSDQGPQAPFAVGRQTSMLGQGPAIVDHDLLLVRDGLLFMGAKHVDGRQFDSPAARPVALQIPLERKDVAP